MRHAVLTTTVLLAAIGSSTVQAQQSAPGNDAAARMEAAMQVALEAGIPTTLLTSKIAEGRAKGVSEAHIAAAVERRAAVLVEVKLAMEARSSRHPDANRPHRAATALTEADLRAAADARERGVSGAALASIAAQAGEDRAVALAVLAELVAQGRPVDQAVVAVNAAASRGVAALAQLGSTSAATAAAATAGGTANQPAHAQGSASVNAATPAAAIGAGAAASISIRRGN